VSYTSNTEEKAAYTISPRRRPQYRRQGQPSFQGGCYFLGIFLEGRLCGELKDENADELVKGDPQELDDAARVSEAAHRTKIVTDIIRIVLRFVGSSWRRADDGVRRRCRQSWTVVHPAVDVELQKSTKSARKGKK
jgi:hypothetical protein